MKFKNMNVEMPVLILTVGTSYSGKTTFLKNHTSEFPPEIIISPDNIRREVLGDVNDQSRGDEIWGIAAERVRETLNKYKICVLDALNITSKYRGEFLRKFPGVYKIAIVFPVDFEEILRRRDDDVGKDRSQVPLDVLRRQVQNYHNGLGTLGNQFDLVLDSENF